jgi:hypothetical protein
MLRTLLILTLMPGTLMPASPVPRFRHQIIATGLKGGYQVAAADVNGDGKPDLVALASGMPELVWFENPSWERRVLAGGQTRMINLAAWDSDGDRIPEIVLASAFSNEAANSPGIVSVLRRQGDPRQPWEVREIDRLPTSHRIRVADIDGSGRKVFVNAPLTGPAAKGPDYRGRTPLVYYRPGEWERRLIGDENEGVVHGFTVFDWDGDGRDEILTASFSGIHLYDYSGGKWTRSELARGDPSPWPKCGASEIAVGHLGPRRFLCSIEPWHGNQVVVYRQSAGAWRRQVLDDSFADGHTVHAADLDGDGRDEIIAGYRGRGYRACIYTADDGEGERWTRHLLDDEVAVASCAVAGFTGSGRLDIACIGSSTANLKLYVNEGGR